MLKKVQIWYNLGYKSKLQLFHKVFIPEVDCKIKELLSKMPNKLFSYFHK